MIIKMVLLHIAALVSASLLICSSFLVSTVNGKVAGKDFVTDVHIVYMNHLDVGYDGINPVTGYINNVLNAYFTEHFPRALNLTRDLRERKYTETFIYTTHPWLIKLYLDCPANFTLSGVTLKCPSANDRQAMLDALHNGDVTYHAGPMNMQPENMNQMLFELSLNISIDLDMMLNKARQYPTLSQRDVPGMTVAVIPTLVKKKIAAVSVGVNSGTSPPAVPKLFLWKYDDNNQVIAMWHAGGYPNNPGPYPSQPEGISRDDCVVTENFSSALCFAFRTDNSGPPINVEEILSYYEILRAEFPNAYIHASTFENFVASIQPIKNQLPVLSNEIGDTWISGISSDPKKMAEYWAVTKVLTECINAGQCDAQTDPRITDAVFYLIKPGEHTWGLPSVGDTVNWTNPDFNRAKTGSNYVNCSQAWYEQRAFVDLAILSLKDHPVVDSMYAALNALIPKRIPLEGFAEVDPTATYTYTDGMKIAFGGNGAISYLYDPYNQVNWAHSMDFGRFIYRTYDENDFNVTSNLYSYGWYFFTKTNLTRNSNVVSKVWDTKLDKLYKSQGSDFILLAKIVLVDSAAYILYGAPREVWIMYKYTAETSMKGFDVKLLWFDKTSTRIPESLMFYFSPIPSQPRSQENMPWSQEKISWIQIKKARLMNAKSILTSEFEIESMKRSSDYKKMMADYAWKLNKLGYMVDPSTVILNGSQYLHAVDSDVYYTTSSGDGIQFTTFDVPLVSLGTLQTEPSPFPVPLKPIEQTQINGFAFNIYNNMWDTNYIFWYPYRDEDADFMSRYRIQFLKN